MASTQNRLHLAPKHTEMPRARCFDGDFKQTVLKVKPLDVPYSKSVFDSQNIPTIGPYKLCQKLPGPGDVAIAS